MNTPGSQVRGPRPGLRGTGARHVGKRDAPKGKGEVMRGRRLRMCDKSGHDLGKHRFRRVKMTVASVRIGHEEECPAVLVTPRARAAMREKATEMKNSNTLRQSATGGAE